MEATALRHRPFLVAVGMLMCAALLGMWWDSSHAVPQVAHPSTHVSTTPVAKPTPTAPALTAGQRKQLAYMEAHWNERDNPTFGNLDSVGGDCANFVSQTLLARGWTMNDGWFDHGGTDRTESWGYVPAMDDYLAANAARLGLQRLTAADRDEFAVGDVVVFSWEGAADAATDRDHVEVISRITPHADGTITVELASHNNYGLHRDLDEQITKEHPGATFHVWHLTRDTNT
ncbi:amidase domain-containing protein [Gryllotalpicola ginsengisoli]|uniref:amidase domain-containing protein n=1 Tax=Gryllotalpicola ginsengisoli TaxID=444608 RepID=UPI00138AF816|nr:amidase domain-containing protein [Gryllotalpicola ginsengisoli]